MQPRKTVAEDKPPSPMFVALVSLFGYPGAGHIMVGKKRQGIVIGVLFTLVTIAIVVEIAYLVPVAFAYIQGDPFAVHQPPNWPRMGLWVVLTAILWVGSAIHAGYLAKQIPSPVSSSDAVPGPTPVPAPIPASTSEAP